MTPDAADRTPGPPEHTASATTTASSGALPPTANPYARTYVNGPFTVVEVLGEIDMATAGFLCEHLDAATARPGPDVLVDLRHVDFFDCSGLRELCRADSRARERGGRLRLVSDTPRLHRLLYASGLLRRFPPVARIPE
ncbi:MAG: STAS domain-containing protein [Streptomyces turgidiscabies]|nr:STAS domain-containing protein [Streptomyces turgidiscabies]